MRRHADGVAGLGGHRVWRGSSDHERRQRIGVRLVSVEDARSSRLGTGELLKAATELETALASLPPSKELSTEGAHVERTLTDGRVVKACIKPALGRAEYVMTLTATDAQLGPCDVLFVDECAPKVRSFALDGP